MNQKTKFKMNNTKKMIEFFRGVKNNECGRQEMENLKKELNPDECELIDAIIDVMLKGTNYGAELMTAALMAVYQSEDPEKDGTLRKCIQSAAQVKFNPMLLVACLHTLGHNNISREWLLKEMLHSLKDLMEEHEEDESENHADDSKDASDPTDDFRATLRKFLDA